MYKCCLCYLKLPCYQRHIKMLKFYDCEVAYMLITSMFLMTFTHLYPCDAIRWHRSGSILAQVIACCLVAPSHYLNQCWLLISEVLYSSESNFTARASANIRYNEFEKCTLKIIPTFPWANELTHEEPRDFSRSRLQFWITSSGHWRWLKLLVGKRKRCLNLYS